MDLSYRRAWSRDEVRAARTFFLDNWRPASEAVPGLCVDTTSQDALDAVSEDLPGEVVYHAAFYRDEIVAVHCLRDLASEDHDLMAEDSRLRGARWWIVGYGSNPAYEPIALYWNMMQTVARDVMDEGDQWVAQQPVGRVVQYLLTLPWVDYADEPYYTENGTHVCHVFGTAGVPRALRDVSFII
jgi:hypothetical protein